MILLPVHQMPRNFGKPPMDLGVISHAETASFIADQNLDQA